jgi:hypothetical protein
MCCGRASLYPAPYAIPIAFADRGGGNASVLPPSSGGAVVPARGNGNGNGSGTGTGLSTGPSSWAVSGARVRTDFSALPQWELTDLILTFVPWRDLTRVMCVNRRLREYARREHLWKAIVQFLAGPAPPPPAPRGALMPPAAADQQQDRRRKPNNRRARRARAAAPVEPDDEDGGGGGADEKAAPHPAPEEPAQQAPYAPDELHGHIAVPAPGAGSYYLALKQGLEDYHRRKVEAEAQRVAQLIQNENKDFHIYLTVHIHAHARTRTHTHTHTSIRAEVSRALTCAVSCALFRLRSVCWLWHFSCGPLIGVCGWSCGWRWRWPNRCCGWWAPSPR